MKAACAAVAGLTCVLWVRPDVGFAQTGSIGAVAIKQRHLGAEREAANKKPRSEADQTIVDGWPLYRNERGQTAFNDAMATLAATDVVAPSVDVFKGCADLQCALTLPRMRADGWLQPGRLWLSPQSYVLIAHSHREADPTDYDRRSRRQMRYFVFHEFHNSSRNVDIYDTIASHRRSVFVPFYMSRAKIDAKGRRFVIVMQVAPYDVDSIHATNLGSAGPGIEVARNASDPVEPLQNYAGIIVAAIVKQTAPHLKVVNHRGAEGRPMLEAYEARADRLEGRTTGVRVTLPFTPASNDRMATAKARLADLVLPPGARPPAPVAERTFMPPRVAVRPSEPRLVGPIQLARRPAAPAEPVKEPVPRVGSP